jgi:hypothetical protein
MSLKPVYVYVAGPFSGDEDGNANRAIDFAERIRAIDGIIPFVPHLSRAWDARHPGHDYEVWMRWCLAWVERCDAIVRIPGKSPGADREIAHAKACDLSLVLESWPDNGMLEFMLRALVTAKNITPNETTGASK